MNTISIVVILGYLLLIIGTILFNGRKSKKSFKDYALAGGKLPWFVICGTIVASTIGGGSLMGFVGSFYEYGTMYFWMVIGSFASYLILIFFLSERINRLKVYSSFFWGVGVPRSLFVSPYRCHWLPRSSIWVSSTAVH